MEGTGCNLEIGNRLYHSQRLINTQKTSRQTNSLGWILLNPTSTATHDRGERLQIKGTEWFATRLKDFGYAGSTVYSADVPPRHVLGLIQRRNEHEVVVNPYGLRNWTALGMSALPAGEVHGS